MCHPPTQTTPPAGAPRATRTSDVQPVAADPSHAIGDARCHQAPDSHFCGGSGQTQAHAAALPASEDPEERETARRATIVVLVTGFVLTVIVVAVIVWALVTGFTS
uniref:Uncharacterized protein n=1 Tax=Neobodo designis TaxID=312471 RepID=A0A7S1MT95_NEODS|mmetsp:Transcript_46397/g.143205  ORF Transcript_46397/g.143205 Transcript_46397/m.143205 type:complete len:106 (+) Transcript_46397:40-357(+)